MVTFPLWWHPRIYSDSIQFLKNIYSKKLGRDTKPGTLNTKDKIQLFEILPSWVRDAYKTPKATLPLDDQTPRPPWAAFRLPNCCSQCTGTRLLLALGTASQDHLIISITTAVNGFIETCETECNAHICPSIWHGGIGEYCVGSNHVHTSLTDWVGQLRIQFHTSPGQAGVIGECFPSTITAMLADFTFLKESPLL